MAYETEVIRTNAKRPEAGTIRRAALLVRKGELVAFPTETVYGLGANARDAKAVRKIYKAKGRPSDNPLIVHIADAKDLASVASEIPPVAKKLAAKFWPGPLTLVLKKGKGISDAATAGGDTVGVRVPANPIARALIRAAGVPIAAPSANTSTRPSPTDARHVEEDLRGIIPLVLDGGRTRVGVESTVVDCTVAPPAILREGGTSRERIERVIGRVSTVPRKKKGAVRSPGQKYKHYSPRAAVVLVRGEGVALRRKTRLLARRYAKRGNVRILASSDHCAAYHRSGLDAVPFGRAAAPATVARKIFGLFRACDAAGIRTIVVESIPEKGLGAAVMDRLSRAAAKIV